MHSNTPTPKSFLDYDAMKHYVFKAHCHHDKSISMEKLEDIDFWDSWKTMARRGRECGFDQLTAEYTGPSVVFRVSKEKILVGDIVHSKVYLYERDCGLTADISCHSVEDVWELLVTSFLARKRNYLAYREEYTPEERAYRDSQYLL